MHTSSRFKKRLHPLGKGARPSVCPMIIKGNHTPKTEVRGISNWLIRFESLLSSFTVHFRGTREPNCLNGATRTLESKRDPVSAATTRL